MLIGQFKSFTAISARTDPGFKRLAVGGVLMGAGIGLMHYSGMAAMQRPPGSAAGMSFSEWIAQSMRLSGSPVIAGRGL